MHRGRGCSTIAAWTTRFLCTVASPRWSCAADRPSVAPPPRGLRRSTRSCASCAVVASSRPRFPWAWTIRSGRCSSTSRGRWRGGRGRLHCAPTRGCARSPLSCNVSPRCSSPSSNPLRPSGTTAPHPRRSGGTRPELLCSSSRCARPRGTGPENRRSPAKVVGAGSGRGRAVRDPRRAQRRRGRRAGPGLPRRPHRAVAAGGGGAETSRSAVNRWSTCLRWVAAAVHPRRGRAPSLLVDVFRG